MQAVKGASVHEVIVSKVHKPRSPGPCRACVHQVVASSDELIGREHATLGKRGFLQRRQHGLCRGFINVVQHAAHVDTVHSPSPARLFMEAHAV